MIRAVAIAIVLASGAARADNGAPLTLGPQCPCDVVGFSSCHPFGAWAVGAIIPDLIIEVGTEMRHIELDMPFAPAARTSGMTPGSRRAGLFAVGGTDRLGIGLPHHLYLAMETSVDGIVSAGTTTPDPYAYVGLGGVLGVRHRAGRASVSVELAGGVGIVSFDPASNATDRAFPVVEARVRGELWLEPVDRGGGRCRSECDHARQLVERLVLRASYARVRARPLTCVLPAKGCAYTMRIWHAHQLAHVRRRLICRCGPTWCGARSS